MYPNIEAEKARQKLTLATMADALNITQSTLSLKLNGKAPITMSEAAQIKNILKSDLPLEDLFAEGVI